MSLQRLGLSFVAVSAIAVGAMACSDPVLPPSGGAWSASFQSKGSICPVHAHNAMVGDVDASTRTSVVTDGVDGATLGCTVSDQGGKFRVQAAVTRKGSTLSLLIPELDPGATQASPSKGRVIFTSPTSVKSYHATDESPCNFYFTPGTRQSVDAGKVWLTFDCPAVFGENDAECSLGTSYAIFENCDE